MEELQNIIDKTWYVYMHENKINHKKYIGVTSQLPKRRWGDGGSRYKQNPAFYAAIQKYGWDNFEHIIVAEGLSQEKAKQMEKELIYIYKTNCIKYKNPSYGYNLTDGGDGMEGYSPSEETRQKIREVHLGKKASEETKIKLSKAHKGRTHTDETKQKLSESHSGENNPNYGKQLSKETKKKLSISLSGENNPMYGKNHTESTKRKIQEKVKKYWENDDNRQKLSKLKRGTQLRGDNPKAHPIVQLTVNNVFIRYWDCIKDAAENVGVNESCIRGCLTRKQKTAGGYKWMDKKGYDNTNKKHRLIVLSDIHGFYDEMIDALDKVSFNPENDFLISLGDNWDRGPNPVEVMNFLNNLPHCVLVKGNHESLLEECCERGYTYSYDYSNGTFDTICEFGDAGGGIPFKECCIKTIMRTGVFLNKMVDYFETKNYIFVHGWIPLKCNDDLPVHYTRGRDFKFNPDWRSANKEEWEQARWLNGIKMAFEGFIEPNKTIVCGHWHCSYGHHLKSIKTDNWISEFDGDACFDPYYDNGIIAIDACTAHTGKVNVIVLEDDFLND